jgi:hypothetical protein
MEIEEGVGGAGGGDVRLPGRLRTIAPTAADRRHDSMGESDQATVPQARIAVVLNPEPEVAAAVM